VHRPRRRRGPRALSRATGPFRRWRAVCVVAFVLSLFAARLVQLQGIDDNDYAALAMQKNAATVTLEAPRASVYDRNGIALAQSVDAAKLVADPTFTTKNALAIASALHRRLSVDYISTLTLLRKPDTRYVELARHLDPDVAARTVDYLNARRWAGVYVDKDTLRSYPAGDLAANLLGFTGQDNTGLAGFEKSLDSTLAGKDGSATYQMADGQQLPLANETVKEPVEGTGVRLTIDENLQFLAQRRLAVAVKQAGGISGTAVVMDVKTGQLLALADYPSFDPNDYQDYSPANYGSRALKDVYEPGSVEKILTFASLIDAGYVTPRTEIKVPASPMERDGSRIHDYFEHGPLHLTAAGVVAKSSNIGTVLASARMPTQQFYDYLRSFGLGSRTGVGLAGESPGLLPAPSQWLPITHDTVSFGQGLSVNAVQMAAAISAVANGGVYVQPSLVESYVDSAGDVTPASVPQTHRVVSAAAARAVSRMMELVVGPEGTAPDAAIDGYRVAGKTGTAQRPGKDGEYHGFTVSFAGFAPADAPRFMVYVVVQKPKDGGGGGSTAGPVFHDLMAATLKKFGVPPTGTTQPALPVTW
jgi:cell division protein FtsI (penicillin-binding protein 3)